MEDKLHGFMTWKFVNGRALVESYTYGLPTIEAVYAEINRSRVDESNRYHVTFVHDAGEYPEPIIIRKTT